MSLLCLPFFSLSDVQNILFSFWHSSSLSCVERLHPPTLFDVALLMLNMSVMVFKSVCTYTLLLLWCRFPISFLSKNSRTIGAVLKIPSNAILFKDCLKKKGKVLSETIVTLFVWHGVFFYRLYLFMDTIQFCVL